MLEKLIGIGPMLTASSAMAISRTAAPAVIRQFQILLIGDMWS